MNETAVVNVIGNVVLNDDPPVFAIIGEPVIKYIPNALNVLVLKSVVPLAKLKLLVAPSVKLLANVHVAVLAALPKIHGQS